MLSYLVLVNASLALCASLPAGAAPALTVGVPVSEWHVAKWSNGSPVAKPEDGKMAWIGHSMAGLDKQLAKPVERKNTR